jgi:hypothetical protein
MGENLTAVTANLSGLRMETSYHFRVVALNEGGIVYGGDQEFKTSHLPPFLVTEPASLITQTSVTLNAFAFMHGWTIQSCDFEYGISTSYDSSGPCTLGNTPAVFLSVGGLSPATTYHFRLVVKTTEGAMSWSVDHMFTTLSAVAIAPSTTPNIQGTSEPPAQKQKARDTLAELVGRSFVASPRGSVRVVMDCPASVSRCAGQVMLRTTGAVSIRAGANQSHRRRGGALILAVKRYTLAGGQTKTITLRLSTAAQRLLTHVYVLRGQAVIFARDLRGEAQTTRTTITLRVAG